MGHVCRNFAGRESKLTVEDLVDVAQRVGESVPQLSGSGTTVSLIRQRSKQTLPFLQSQCQAISF